MLNRIAIKVTNHMENKGTFSPSDREIYFFGVYQGLFMILNIITMALIGLVSGAFLYVFVFALAYIPLRSFAGGYHAKTQLRCYIASTAMILFVVAASPIITLSIQMEIALLLIFGVHIIVLSPVGHANKPLDDLEKKVYKKKAVKICIGNVAVALIFIPMGIQFITTGILWALLMVLFFQVLERLVGKKSEDAS